MDAPKKKRVIAVIIVLILSVCVAFSIRESGAQSSGLEVQSKLDIDPELDNVVEEDMRSVEMDDVDVSVQEIPETLPVYICGAVACPGVYYIDTGTFLFELIDEAGGFSEYAATDYINLVLVINDSLSIYIPTHTEIENNVGSFNDPAGVLIRPSSNTWSWGDQDTDGLSQSSAQRSGLININTASASELATLPGIGDATAQAIITHRETQGHFNRIEDIMNVSGIKDSRFNAIHDYITVD